MHMPEVAAGLTAARTGGTVAVFWVPERAVLVIALHPFLGGRANPVLVRNLGGFRPTGAAANTAAGVCGHSLCWGIAL